MSMHCRGFGLKTYLICGCKFDKISNSLFDLFWVYCVFGCQENEPKNSLTYSKIWTNDNQVQDLTKLIN